MKVTKPQFAFEDEFTRYDFGELSKNRKIKFTENKLSPTTITELLIRKLVVQLQ